MGLRITTNIASVNAQKNLKHTRHDLNKNLEKLSTGYRINRAEDDAAGLSISEHLKAEIKGLAQARRNGYDGISMIQVAEGGLNEVSNMLIRMRELAVHAASDTIGPLERKYLNAEYEQLSNEIERIADGTVFLGNPLLNGTGAVYDFQIGVKNDPNIDRISFDSSRADINLAALGLNLTAVSDQISAQNSIGALDKGMDTVNEIRAEFGAMQSRLQSTVNNLDYYLENLTEANSRIRDVDIAEETADLTKNSILLQAGTAVLAQANVSTSAALTLLNQLTRA